MAALIGQFDKPLDDKSRLVIPSEFRRELEEVRLVLVQWFDHTLALFPETTWMEMAGQIDELGDYSAEARGMRRLFYSRARPVSLDKQGRFLVPEEMRAYAYLDRETVLIGDWDKVVIWSRPRYHEMNAADDQDLDRQYEKTLTQIAKMRRGAGKDGP